MTFLVGQQLRVVQLEPASSRQPEGARVEAGANQDDTGNSVDGQSLPHEVVNDAVSCHVARGGPRESQNRRKFATNLSSTKRPANRSPHTGRGDAASSARRMQQ